MATNPNRRNAKGVWKLRDISSFSLDGEYPGSQPGGNRGFFAGGGGPASNVIDFIELASSGNAADFGDLVKTTIGAGVTSNAVRTLISGGYEPSTQYSNRIQYIQPQSKGHTSDFGNLTAGCGYPTGMANTIRVVQANGNENPNLNQEMDQITIATLGNSTDFGDLNGTARYAGAGAHSSTRGLYAGGRIPSASPVFSNIIDMFVLQTTGAGVDYGDLATATHYMGGCSDGITGVFTAGSQTTNSSQAVHIASTGNSYDFNDLTIYNTSATMSGGSRAFHGGGRFESPNSAINVIETFDIVTRSDGTDFGDLTVSRYFYGPSADTTNNGGQIVTPVQLGVPRPGLDHVKDRALLLGGQAPGATNNIDKIQISLKSNGSDFGDLVGTRNQQGGAGNTIKALASNGDLGGANSTQTDRVFFATEGNAADFGNATAFRNKPASLSNDTRAVFVGGHNPSKLDTIDFHVFATEGNATDFGDATTVLTQAASTASQTRGITGGGGRPGSSNVIDFITIASAGNSTDFGDLTVARQGLGAGGSSVRGLFAGVYPVGNVIDFVTIASAGDASDFGDLTVSRSLQNGSMSSNTRALFAGGYIHPADPNVSDVVDFVTIASTGNAADHGDLTAGKQNHAGASNAHGGLA